MICHQYSKKQLSDIDFIVIIVLTHSPTYTIFACLLKYFHRKISLSLCVQYTKSPKDNMPQISTFYFTQTRVCTLVTCLPFKKYHSPVEAHPPTSYKHNFIGTACHLQNKQTKTQRISTNNLRDNLHTAD